MYYILLVFNLYFLCNIVTLCECHGEIKGYLLTYLYYPILLGFQQFCASIAIRGAIVVSLDGVACDVQCRDLRTCNKRRRSTVIANTRDGRRALLQEKYQLCSESLGLGSRGKYSYF